jgi:hypothetical protein
MKKVLAAFAALLLTAALTVGGGASAYAAQSIKKGPFTASVRTDDNTATTLVEVLTDSNNVYSVELDSTARGIAGTDQGKGKYQKCILGAQNIAGTLTVGTLVCQTASGSLTATGLAVTTNGTNIKFTVQGAASQAISWVVKVRLSANSSVNVVTTTTTSTTTSTSTSTSTTTSSTTSTSTSTSTTTST